MELFQVCASEASLWQQQGEGHKYAGGDLLRQERATIKASANVCSSGNTVTKGTRQRANFPGNTISVLGHLEFELCLQHADSWQMEIKI